MAEHDEKGTGKHPHKSTSEPYPHTKESGQKESGHEEKGGSRSQSASQGGGHGHEQSSESSDLKSREYRDKEGNIHHHTHTVGKKENEK